jgi:hypothetical protein
VNCGALRAVRHPTDNELIVAISTASAQAGWRPSPEAVRTSP